MHNTSKLGAVGQRSAVLALKALGMQVIPTSTPEETAKALFTLHKNGVNVVFITEKEAMEAPEALERYRNDYSLAIIPIPGTTGSIGYGMQAIKKNVEKAIGADILFQK
ncbi:MAG: V-type ATP synthase subunit F [Eubacteriales bacterium]|nr:V-type ATP synthase subunit F [Eubacteriales bacterium]